MKIKKEFKIGIFAIIAIALLIWGLNFLKGKNIFRPIDTYYCVYDNIDGLVESGIIYLKGYKIGTVGGIEFDPEEGGKIIVEYDLESKVRIPKNSVFQIYTSSLVSGIKGIRLLLSDETEYYQPNDTVPGTIDEGIANIINPIKAQVLKAVGELDTILVSLNNLLNPETISDLQKTFNHFEGISSTLDNGKLDNTITNLSVFSDSLRKSSAELKNLISNLGQFSDSLSDSQFKAAINNANASLINASEILSKIAQGKGTMGMLVNNDSLFVSLQNVSKNLDLLLIDLKSNPKRYVHFSLFGKKENN